MALLFALFAGGPCWRDSTFLMLSVYLCGISLHDISTRERFAFVNCFYWVKAIYALCFTGVCFGFIKIVPNRINYIIQFVTSTNSRNHTQSPRPILHDDSVFWSDPAMRDAIRVRHLLILRNRGRLVNWINFVCHSDHSAGCQWSQFDQLIAEIN